MYKIDLVFNQTKTPPISIFHVSQTHLLCVFAHYEERLFSLVYSKFESWPQTALVAMLPSLCSSRMYSSCSSLYLVVYRRTDRRLRFPVGLAIVPLPYVVQADSVADADADAVLVALALELAAFAVLEAAALESN